MPSGCTRHNTTVLTKISPLNKRINDEAESESEREIENISRPKQGIPTVTYHYPD